MPDPSAPSSPWTRLNQPFAVLLVEDEPRLRDLLLEAIPDMGRSGFSAAGARSGEEALRLMNAQVRDIIILDLNLPGMDGMEFFEQVRQRWPQTQVIILTGFGDLDAARKAIHLQVVDFLSKPCHLSDVELALDRARRRIVELRKINMTDTAPPVLAQPINESTTPPTTLEESERQMIIAALERNRGNRTAAAVELGISRRTLHYRLQEYERQGFIIP